MSYYEHDDGDGMDFITALDRATMIERLHKICASTGKCIVMYADGPKLIIEPMELSEIDE